MGPLCGIWFEASAIRSIAKGGKFLVRKLEFPGKYAGFPRTPRLMVFFTQSLPRREKKQETVKIRVFEISPLTVVAYRRKNTRRAEVREVRFPFLLELLASSDVSFFIQLSQLFSQTTF